MVAATIAGVIGGIAFFIFMHFQMKKREKAEGKTSMKNARLYMRRFALAMMGYVGTLFLSLFLLGRTDIQALRIALAILPILPVSYGLWAYMDWVRNLDELQQRIQLEAVAFSLGMTGVVTFTIGFLENAGVPQPSLIWIFPMIILFWGVGQFIAMRRYE
jgi:hypothetical protein